MYPEVTAQAIQQSSIGGPVGAVPHSPIRSMAEAHARLQEFSARFHSLMQKLIGTGYMTPKPVGTNSTQPINPNLFDALQETSIQQHSLISSLNEALNYLENKLQ